MSRRLIGTLTDPSGTPLAGWTLILDARRNSAPAVPIGSRETVILDGTGGYDLIVTDGLYLAMLTAPSDTIQRRIGSFLVSPGADIDILTLIALYSSATYPGPNPLAVYAEGVQLTAAAASINVTGAGATASTVGNAVTLSVPGGVGAGVTDAEYIVATAHAGLSAERVLTGVAGETSIDAATAGQLKIGLTPHLEAADPHTQYATDADLSGHAGNVSNPHSVTKGQVGLGSADNTSDASKPVSTAQQTALNSKQDISAKGAANGYASLDAGGKVPDAQIPAGVARVIVGQAFSTFPAPSAGIAGLVLRANDAVFPAPGLDLVCSGTHWRPVNGSAVLAIRTTNPVTVQNNAGAVAETLGPFPGGLVKAGMRLEFQCNASYPGVGSGSRVRETRFGSGAIRNVASVFLCDRDEAFLYDRSPVRIDVLSNSNANHGGGVYTFNNSAGSFAFYYPAIDFSIDWSADINLTSANETAKTITGATWAGGVATYTATGHTLNTGDKTTVAGITPSGYSVVGIVTVIDANTFTIPIAVNPGAYTSGGTSSRISNVVSKSYVLTLFG